MNRVTHKNSFLTFNLVVLTLLSGLILSSTSVSAEDTEIIDTIELTVPIAITKWQAPNP